MSSEAHRVAQDDISNEEFKVRGATIVMLPRSCSPFPKHFCSVKSQNKSKTKQHRPLTERAQGSEQTLAVLLRRWPFSPWATLAHVARTCGSTRHPRAPPYLTYV